MAIEPRGRDGICLLGPLGSGSGLKKKEEPVLARFLTMRMYRDQRWTDVRSLPAPQKGSPRNWQVNVVRGTSHCKGDSNCEREKVVAG